MSGFTLNKIQQRHFWQRPLTMQEKCRATQKTQQITHSEGDVPRDKHFLLFFLYPSHIYFIRRILYRLHGGGIAMRSDTHSHTHPYTYVTGPQISTGACSDSIFFFFFPLGVFIFFFFSLSSAEDNKHQQPDIISIGEDTKSSS